MLKKSLIVAGILIVLFAVALYFVYNKPHRSVDNVEATVSAASLVTAFDQNEEDANKQYLDRVIEVKGSVREVIQQEDSFIVLIGGDGSITNVSCTLEPGQDLVAYGLKPGDDVIVRGICTGFLMDVVLIKCIIVNDGETQM